MSCALTIARGHTRALDRAEIRFRDAETGTWNETSTPTHSLLSTSWGFFSDVDVESEKFRFLGGARFTLQAIVRILSRRTYRCDFLYETTARGREHNERHYADADLGVRLSDRPGGDASPATSSVCGRSTSRGARRPPSPPLAPNSTTAPSTSSSCASPIAKTCSNSCSISTPARTLQSRRRLPQGEIFRAHPGITRRPIDHHHHHHHHRYRIIIIHVSLSSRPPPPPRRARARGGGFIAVDGELAASARTLSRGTAPSLRRVPRPVSRLRPSSDRLNTILRRVPVPVETLGPDRPSGTSVVRSPREDGREGGRDATRTTDARKRARLDASAHRDHVRERDDRERDDRDRDAGGGCGWKPGDE